MEPDAVRRWIDSRRAAEEREHAELVRSPFSAETSIQQALALVALAGRLQGWPLPEDPHSREQDEQAYAHWTRLRSALATPSRS